jgi:hypothetical protein
MNKLTVEFAPAPDPAKWRAGVKLITQIALELLAEQAGQAELAQPVTDEICANLELEEPEE